MTRRSAVILLVEDDSNYVLLIKRALKEAGVEQTLRTARDGEEALRYLEGSGLFADRSRHPLPCLILMNVKLPKVDGLEVLRWLRGRAEFQEIPVLMVTSSDEPFDREEAERNGVEGCRVKPVSFDEFVKIAREVRAAADDHCRDAEPCPKEAPARPERSN